MITIGHPLVRQQFSSELWTSSQTSDIILSVQAEKTFSDIIENLAANIEPEGNKNVINVERTKVLDGGFRGFGRKSFDPKRALSVRFTEEEGIDAGGPTKELLRLLLKAIQSELSIFHGPENFRNMLLDYKALTKNTYETAGRILAYSVVHGGPVPSFLSKPLYTAISEGYAAVKVTWEDVPDVSLKAKLQQVLNATSEEEYQTLLTSLNELIERAGCMSFRKLADNKALVASICHYQVVGHCMIAIEQFKCGLSTLGVLQSIQENPAVMSQAFLHVQQNLDVVESMFLHINWSTPGSNRQNQEKTTITHWRDLLQDLEESQQLQDLLIFVTGLNNIPALGFRPEPSLAFKHHDSCEPGDHAWEFPNANTCTNTLTLPVVETFDQFANNVKAALMMATTFSAS